MGLLALMLLHESRRPARTSAQGGVRPASWKTRTARFGTGIHPRRDRSRGKSAHLAPVRPVYVTGGLAAVHGEAAAAEATDWAQIAALYDLLLQMEPSPVIRLNRALAVAMRDGPAAGLALIQDVIRKENSPAGPVALLRAGRPAPASGQAPEAQAAYRKALSMSQQEPERRYFNGGSRSSKKIVWMCVEFGGRQTTKGAGPK